MKKFERKIPSKHKKEKEKLVKVEKISKLLQQSSLSLSLSQRPELFLSLHLVHLSSSCTSGHNAGKGRAKVGRLSRSVARPSARVASNAALQIHTYIHCTAHQKALELHVDPHPDIYIYIYGYPPFEKRRVYLIHMYNTRPAGTMRRARLLRLYWCTCLHSTYCPTFASARGSLAEAAGLPVYKTPFPHATSIASITNLELEATFRYTPTLYYYIYTQVCLASSLRRLQRDAFHV